MNHVPRRPISSGAWLILNFCHKTKKKFCFRIVLNLLEISTVSLVRTENDVRQMTCFPEVKLGSSALSITQWDQKDLFSYYCFQFRSCSGFSWIFEKNCWFLLHIYTIQETLGLPTSCQVSKIYQDAETMINE